MGLPADRDLAFTWWASVASLVPRLYVAVAWAREPVWDGHYYDYGAKRIAAGFGYSDDIVVGGATVWHPWCHYPVGYSGFLAGVYKLFGEGGHAGTIANAVVGALTVALVHRISLYMMTPARARLAAVLCALHPGLILYSAVLMTEPLAAAGPLLALWVALRDRGAHALRGAILSGVVLGLSTLVHPQSILLAPALGTALVVRPGLASWRTLAARTALVSACALAVVAPWTIRNCRVMDGCAFVSTNGGWNLAIGAFSRATGRFETIRASDGCAVVTGQVQQDRCWARVGWEAIRRDPWRWIRLAPKKLAYTFDHESFPVEYLREADPQAWPEPRRVWWRGLLTAAHRLLLSVAVFGFVARASRGWRAVAWETALLSAGAGLVAWAYSDDIPTFYPLAIALPVMGMIPRPSAPYRGPVGSFVVFSVVAVLVTHVVFFGEDRYHMVLSPLLCVMAAAALRVPQNVDPVLQSARGSA